MIKIRVCQPRLTTCRDNPYAPRVEVTPKGGEYLLVKGIPRGRFAAARVETASSRESRCTIGWCASGAILVTAFLASLSSTSRFISTYCKIYSTTHIQDRDGQDRDGQDRDGQDRES